MKRWLICGALVVAALAALGAREQQGGTAASGDARRATTDCSGMTQFSSCAAGIAGLSGRIAGASIRCGIPVARGEAFGRAIGVRIREVAKNATERDDALRLFRLAMLAEANKTTTADCASVIASFASAERSAGLR
jgi:hypothetical protein